MGVEVKVEGLTKSFGRQVIWENVSLTLPKGEISVLLGPSGTGKSVFLKHLVAKYDRIKVFLIIDNAPCHNLPPAGKRWLTENRRRIELHRLPPYSPELNPMENIWDYLRGNKLSMRVWDSYEAIVAACKEAWLFLVGDPDRIDSIAHRAWVWVNL